MKQFFRFSILLLALLLPALAMAHDFEVDGIYYNINGNEATVTYYGSSPYDASHRYSGSVVIPATVTYSGTTYPVTAIGNSAFSDCSGLISIDIPNSVTSIGVSAFCNCTGLTSIVVESGNPKYDSRNNCNAIIETASNTLIVGCENTIIPNTVTAIGNSAFDNFSGLTSIDIPNSVTSIGEGAFWGCSGLTSITIPNSVTFIGDGAFHDCTGLTSVNIHDLDAWCKIDFNNFYSNPLYYAQHLFIDGEETTDLVIPESVTSIGGYAFYGCTGLTNVTIPNSVTSIGEEAFYNCI